MTDKIARRRLSPPLFMLLATAILSLGSAGNALAQTWVNGYYTLGNIVVAEPLSLSVLRKGRVSAIVIIAPSLEISDSNKLKAISNTMPRLRDAWLRNLIPYTKKLDLNAPVAVDTVAAILQRTVETLYGKGHVKVLITFTNIRKI